MNTIRLITRERYRIAYRQCSQYELAYLRITTSWDHNRWRHAPVIFRYETEPSAIYPGSDEAVILWIQRKSFHNFHRLTANAWGLYHKPSEEDPASCNLNCDKFFWTQTIATAFPGGIRSSGGRKWQLCLNIVVALPPKPPRLDSNRPYLKTIRFIGPGDGFLGWLMTRPAHNNSKIVRRSTGNSKYQTRVRFSA